MRCSRDPVQAAAIAAPSLAGVDLVVDDQGRWYAGGTTYGGYVKVVHRRTDATLDSRDQASVGPVTEPECGCELVGERARAGE